MSLARGVRSITKAVVDFCFPNACLACQEPCEGEMCVKCALMLHQLATAPHCARCAAPVAYEAAPCPRCAKAMPVGLDRVVALGVYEEPLSTLIQAIKYHKAWEWAAPLADRLIDYRSVRDYVVDGALIVPIPLHPWRKFCRTFNQAELIAERLSKRLKVPWSEPLLRIRHTETQTHMPSAARRESNVKGAFALDRARTVRGRHVILIDDVMTTGATLRVAASALRPARPASISTWVLAVADPKHRGFESIR
jgi:ComF family protein